ncbi:MAG: hypothetical protein HQL54_04645 [Magnetococcales bacterium]|nr:hypothetical protein [Magnetococcales bacterium]
MQLETGNLMDILQFIKKRTPVRGQLGLFWDGDGVALVSIRQNGQRPLVQLLRYITAAPNQLAKMLGEQLREERLTRQNCTCVLPLSAYDISPIEKPAGVPDEEMATAVRYLIRERVSYDVDSAVVDVFHMPEEGSDGQDMIYVASASEESVTTQLEMAFKAKVKVQIVDVQELAQRNIAALTPEDETGVALLNIEGDYGVLTVTKQGDLFVTRRLETGLNRVLDGMGGLDALKEAQLVDEQAEATRLEEQNRVMEEGGQFIDPQEELTLAPLLNKPLEGPLHLVDFEGLLANDWWKHRFKELVDEEGRETVQNVDFNIDLSDESDDDSVELADYSGEKPEPVEPRTTESEPIHALSNTVDDIETDHDSANLSDFDLQRDSESISESSALQAFVDAMEPDDQETELPDAVKDEPAQSVSVQKQVLEWVSPDFQPASAEPNPDGQGAGISGMAWQPDDQWQQEAASNKSDTAVAAGMTGLSWTEEVYQVEESAASGRGEDKGAGMPGLGFSVERLPEIDAGAIEKSRGEAIPGLKMGSIETDDFSSPAPEPAPKPLSIPVIPAIKRHTESKADTFSSKRVTLPVQAPNGDSVIESQEAVHAEPVLSEESDDSIELDAAFANVPDQSDWSDDEDWGGLELSFSPDDPVTSSQEKSEKSQGDTDDLGSLATPLEDVLSAAFESGSHQGWDSWDSDETSEPEDQTPQAAEMDQTDNTAVDAQSDQQLAMNFEFEMPGQPDTPEEKVSTEIQQDLDLSFDLNELSEDEAVKDQASNSGLSDHDSVLDGDSTLDANALSFSFDLPEQSTIEETTTPIDKETADSESMENGALDLSLDDWFDSESETESHVAEEAQKRVEEESIELAFPDLGLSDLPADDPLSAFESATFDDGMDQNSGFPSLDLSGLGDISPEQETSFDQSTASEAVPEGFPVLDDLLATASESELEQSQPLPAIEQAVAVPESDGPPTLPVDLPLVSSEVEQELSVDQESSIEPGPEEAQAPDLEFGEFIDPSEIFGTEEEEQDELAAMLAEAAKFMDAPSAFNGSEEDEAGWAGEMFSDPDALDEQDGGSAYADPSLMEVSQVGGLWAASSVMDSFCVDVQRALDYYEKHYRTDPVSCLYLISSDPSLPGIREAFSERMSVRVKWIDPAALFDFEGEMPSTRDVMRCLPAIGGILRREESAA